MIYRVLYHLARLLPRPWTPQAPAGWSWGHDYITPFPFVVVVQHGAKLEDPCEILHENVHTAFALVFIVAATLLGCIPGGWWVGGGFLLGWAAYGVTNAFEPWWFEQAAERVEDICHEEAS